MLSAPVTVRGGSHTHVSFASLSCTAECDLKYGNPAPTKGLLIFLRFFAARKLRPLTLAQIGTLASSPIFRTSSCSAMSDPVRTTDKETAATNYTGPLPTVAGNEPPRAPDAKCAVCSKGAAVYKCPACLVLTCSVKCVKTHKETTGCTGKRPRSEFAPINKFSEAMLLRDYRFLEEVARSADASHRGIREYGTMRVPLNRGRGRGGRGRGRGGHTPKAFGLPHLPRHLHLLMRAAKDRSVSLRLMPLGMQRHIDNTSRYDTKQDALWWRVEWLFLLEDGSSLRAASYRVPDDAGVAAAAGRALAYLTAAPAAQHTDSPDKDTPPPHVALGPLLAPPQAAAVADSSTSPWQAAADAWGRSALSAAAPAPAPELLPPKQRRPVQRRAAKPKPPARREAAEVDAPNASPSGGAGSQAGDGASPAAATASDTAQDVDPVEAAAANLAAANAAAAVAVAALPLEPAGLFLQHPYAERGEHVYHSVPGTATLRAALWGRSVVEFPCFAVCLSAEQTAKLALRKATDAALPPYHLDEEHDSDEEQEHTAQQQAKRPRSVAPGAGAGQSDAAALPAAAASAAHAGSVRWAHNTFAPPQMHFPGHAMPAYSTAPPVSTAAPNAAAFSAAAAAVAQRAYNGSASQPAQQ